jgi:hypothetical protein
VRIKLEASAADSCRQSQTVNLGLETRLHHVDQRTVASVILVHQRGGTTACARQSGPKLYIIIHSVYKVDSRPAIVSER